MNASLVSRPFALAEKSANTLPLFKHRRTSFHGEDAAPQGSMGFMGENADTPPVAPLQITTEF
jgi:hypothetical protein